MILRFWFAVVLGEIFLTEAKEELYQCCAMKVFEGGFLFRQKAFWGQFLILERKEVGFW